MEKDDIEKIREIAREEIERERQRVETDAKFIAAGHKPEDTRCKHEGYDRNKDGRYCLKCGTAMWDGGD